MGSSDNRGPEEAQGYTNQRALTYFTVRRSGFTFSFSTFCCGRFALEWLFQLALFWLKGNAKRIKSSEGILLWNSPRVETECRGRENISTSPRYMIYWGPYEPITETSVKTALKNRLLILSKIFATIPSHPSYSKEGNLCWNWREGTGPDTRQRW